MNKRSIRRELSGNPKSKIQNLNWVGFITFVVTFAFCGLAGAQPKKVHRIGYLSTVYPSPPSAFRQGLRELSCVEGKNFIIEYPKAEGNFTGDLARAAELVRLKVDVIVTGGATNTRAAKDATTTIPLSCCRIPIRLETVL